MAENTKVSRFANFRKNFVRFFKEIRTELKKVIWPTREQLVNNTITVLITCLVIGAIIWIADFAFTQLLEWTLVR
jgi:preprotein translocase subunit SecE